MIFSHHYSTACNTVLSGDHGQRTLKTVPITYTGTDIKYNTCNRIK